MTQVRTRFAPSPTGFLHIGGARTALYAWLFAKKMGGQFLLRIEDTDRERSTQAAIDAIFEGLDWLGLSSNETVNYQTQRFLRYEEVLKHLIESGNAYRCNCSKERLQQLRESQMQQKLKPRYDGHCRNKHLPADTKDFVVRFKNPQEGEVILHDKVYGDIKFSNNELDDLIIARTDGTPTYNFCVVIDDWDMGITHVIRGDDHINNTPRQINILKALNVPIPVYAHVPMILGEDGKKLSKRHGALGVIEYRKMGILPIAMRNYLARLGWSYGDKELFNAQELIELFSLEGLNKSAAALSFDKLFWINQQYLKTSNYEDIAEELIWHFNLAKVKIENGPKLELMFELQKDRVKTLTELVEKSRFFYEDIQTYDDKARDKFLTQETKSVLTTALKAFEALEDFTQANLSAQIKQILQDLELKMPQLAQPLRVALTGNTLSPSIDITLYYIGKQRVISRVIKAIEYIDLKQN